VSTAATLMNATIGKSCGQAFSAAIIVGSGGSLVYHLFCTSSDEVNDRKKVFHLTTNVRESTVVPEHGSQNAESVRVGPFIGHTVSPIQNVSAIVRGVSSSSWSILLPPTHRVDCDAGPNPSFYATAPVDIDPSFPDLSRFGSNSYLKRFLTHDIYVQLKDRRTANGVTLEDLICSGLSLPWGAKPPRGIGIYAGDEESYDVFSELLIPVLEDYHHFRLLQRNKSAASLGVVDSPPPAPSPHRRGSMLRRQFTNLNPNAVLRQKLDPTGDYILQTRMRVARSVRGFAFSPVISREQRRALENLFRECVDDWKDEKDGIGGTYTRVMDMTNEQHDDLIQRHILFHDPDEYNISAGIGRDWPDARGIYMNSTEKPDLMIWLNKEDHLRIISMSNGGDLLAVFTHLTKALNALEKSLKKRGSEFCVHPRYGFVNTSPENLGTALRASVFVKLYRLGQQPGFDELLDRLRLEASSRFKDTKQSRYTGIFDIANAERMGQSEVQLINTMINGVGRLIELEKRLERGEKFELDEIQ
jgi:creatine kinase